MHILQEFEHKKIAILGFGKEGKSSYHFIRKYYPKLPITIADAQDVCVEGLTHVTIKDKNTYQDLEAYDCILKSPGIVIENKNILSKCTSQTDLFLKYYGQQVIGVTGTKGKSTTVSMLFHCLNQKQSNVFLIGNIGVPAFDIIEQLDEKSIVIYELSSHQLEYVNYSPHIAVYLNLYPEHLDHYKDFNAYKAAKENIYVYQKDCDICICNRDLVNSNMCAKIVNVSMFDEEADIVVKESEIIEKNKKYTLSKQEFPLLGIHNIYNFAIVNWICRYFGMSYEEVKQSIASFKGLPHRLEYVGYFHNLYWYDDSISTICEATIQAIESLKNASILILGGMDRGIDYTPLIQYLNKNPLDLVIAMPDSGYRIAKELKQQTVKTVKDLQEAIEVIIQNAKAESTVLLSPAAASYGFFRNFEDRGNTYQQLIKCYQANNEK